MKRNQYFGENEAEEMDYIRGLWIRSMIAFIVGAVLIVLSNKDIVSAFGAFPIFFYVWGFRACFSKGGSMVNSIINIIPVDVARWTIRMVFFAFFGYIAGIYYFVIGNLRLHRLKKGEKYEK